MVYNNYIKIFKHYTVSKIVVFFINFNFKILIKLKNALRASTCFWPRLYLNQNPKTKFNFVFQNALNANFLNLYENGQKNLTRTYLCTCTRIYNIIIIYKNLV